MKRIILTIVTILGILGTGFAQNSTSMAIPVLNDQVPGPGLLVPVNVNFSTATQGVGAFNVDIQFDSKVMTFSAINNAALSGISASVISGNTVRLFWFGDATYLNGKLLDLNFNYHGGNAPLTFLGANSEVSDPNGTPLNVTYTNGQVNMVQLVPGISIANVQANQGEEVLIPFTVDAFYDISGFYLLAEFQQASVITGTVSVINVNPGLGGSLRANFVDGNKVLVSWTANLGGTNVSLANGQKLFDLRFSFNGGTSPIVFSASSELNQNIPPLFPPFPDVNFTNGSITDGIQYFDLNLLAAPDNIGAVLSGAGNYASGQTVSIGTTVPSGYVFAGWTGTYAHLLADVQNPQTSLQMPENNVIFTANFNQVFTVSGILKYANTTGAARPITNSTVYLKTADGLTTIATTTTHAATGAYSFENVPAGDYLLTASTMKPWGGVNVIDYARVRLFVLNGEPSYTGIYYQAADVDQNGVVNVIDYARIRNRVLNNNSIGWSAVNWIFQEVSIMVNQSIENISIIGICLGDVDASYVPPN